MFPSKACDWHTLECLRRSLLHGGERAAVRRNRNVVVVGVSCNRAKLAVGFGYKPDLIARVGGRVLLVRGNHPATLVTRPVVEQHIVRV